MTALKISSFVGEAPSLSGRGLAGNFARHNHNLYLAANASRSGIDSVDFKAANGWHSVTVAQVEAVACAVALHVQACFTAERLHHEAIDLLESIEAVQVYDLGGGWPPTAESGPSATP